eukprot:TRINITY_DN9888_c0_g1_i1.p1 TRINITY_DN9888_c0_g1~~TRINITY_DN9888_c0_g1_i1.p1  ORF type:complete len:230 (-),score=45.56 TRINITY_DN9888_c0_g1_i1:107-796(-)
MSLAAHMVPDISSKHADSASPPPPSDKEQPANTPAPTSTTKPPLSTASAPSAAPPQAPSMPTGDMLDALALSLSAHTASAPSAAAQPPPVSADLLDFFFQAPSPSPSLSPSLSLSPSKGSSVLSATKTHALSSPRSATHSVSLGMSVEPMHTQQMPSILTASIGSAETRSAGQQHHGGATNTTPSTTMTATASSATADLEARLRAWELSLPDFSFMLLDHIELNPLSLM